MTKLEFTTLSVTAAFGLALVGCASAPPPPPKPVEVEKPVVQVAKKIDQLAAGKQAFEAANFAGAVDAYGKHLVENPGDVSATFNRAVALQHLAKLDDAAKGYKAVLAAKPDHEGATLNLGAVYREQGKLDEAVSLYKAALDKKPFQSRVLNNLSGLYRTQKKYKKAIGMLRNLLKRDQRNIDAYKNLALVYYDQQQYTLALTILDNALKMAKEQKVKDPDIFVNKGMIFLAKKENGKAMAAFKKAVEFEPAHLLANFNIGSLALAHRDYNQAAKALEVAKKAWPEDFEVNAALGYAYQGQQKLPEAAKQLEKALALRSDEQLIYQLMIVYQGINDPDRALQYGDKLLALRGKTCTEEDYDGVCGRYNGIKLMKQMAAEPAAPEPEKPKSTGVEVFTEGPAEGDVPAEGEATAGAGEAAPAAAGDATPPTDAAPEGAKPAEGKPAEGAAKTEGGDEARPETAAAAPAPE